MLAAVLALASSLSWGLSDFLGGFHSRRHALLAVLVLSQGFALVVLVAAIAAGAPTGHDGAATAWAVGAGMVATIPGNSQVSLTERLRAARMIERMATVQDLPRVHAETVMGTVVSLDLRAGDADPTAVKAAMAWLHDVLMRRVLTENLADRRVR